MAWIYLLIAIAFEIVFALGANASKGFTRLWISLITLVGIVGGIYFISLALRTLDVSVGYTIWTSVGALGTVVLGAVIFKEKITPAKLLCFAAIIGGVVGLKSMGAA
ncbi:MULTISPECIES: DMT family transporter [Streptomyces]|uniref:Multidrug efflux SMR transporter n=4 Tax=Streptomyces TaxID=1883 RepID=A0A3Q9FU36_STRLT|nr:MULTISPECIES: multidrug efflux SMR transporter [Streptomyces]AZQ70674.1 multidrug efflux SMR transporter [Streptomyces luteoverticillatus]MDT0449991.1 multidrug efflux SMR transporter [Streptomyces sp. DSM 40473]GGP64785.1 transporter [Streptomyces abikoensis]